MKVLVVGSGGREHAICWKLSQDKNVNKIYAIPGNAGISSLAECIPIDVHHVDKIAEFANENKIDWTIVGPELPLALGISDRFKDKSLKVWGPTKDLARLESSKAFAKEFMKKANIPTAEFKIFDNFADVSVFLKKEKYPLVIKADGLAAGKGVFIVTKEEEALEVAHKMLNEGVLGDAGKKIVIEEYLDGKEFSLIAAIKGSNIYYLPPAQDYKRVGDGNVGPNTGGMGSYAPVPWIDEKLIEVCDKKIFKPLLEEIDKMGGYYEGFLYGGLILVNGEPYVLEFNVRLGDPEAQVILPLLEFSLLEFAEEKVVSKKLIKKEKAVCVVLASKGYPEKYDIGKEINIRSTDEVLIFHAGTKLENGRLVTAGGRVMNLVGIDVSFKRAREKVYKNIENVFFENMYYRKDIAKEVEEFC